MWPLHGGPLWPVVARVCPDCPPLPVVVSCCPVWPVVAHCRLRGAVLLCCCWSVWVGLAWFGLVGFGLGLIGLLCLLWLWLWLVLWWLPCGCSWHCVCGRRCRCVRCGGDGFGSKRAKRVRGMFSFGVITRQFARVRRGKARQRRRVTGQRRRIYSRRAWPRLQLLLRPRARLCRCQARRVRRTDSLRCGFSGSCGPGVFRIGAVMRKLSWIRERLPLARLRLLQ